MKDDKSPNHNKEIDDRLAEFTDQLMSDKIAAQPQASADTRTQDLEKTLYRLKTMVDSDNPKPNLSSLLEMRLQHAWEEQQKRNIHDKRSWTANLPGWLRQPSPLLRLSGVVIVLALVVLTLLPWDLPLQGAAGTFVKSFLPWVASASLVIMLIILIDTYRKK